MIVKSLACSTYTVVGVVDGDACPPERFIAEGDESTRASRLGLQQMIEFIAERGLQGVPSGWSHLANQQEQIYELRRGRLRLFYFKGSNGHIAVLTIGAMKDQRKANKSSVNKAIELKRKYEAAVLGNYLEVRTE